MNARVGVPRLRGKAQLGEKGRRRRKRSEERPIKRDRSRY